MDILITGASGFVGGNLVRALAKNKDYKLRLLVRSGANLAYLGGVDFEKIEGDLMDRESLSRACAGCDIVFHAAAHFALCNHDAEKFYQTNVEGTRNICEAALAANVRRLIYTSTAATMGYPGKGKTADEATPFNKWDFLNEYSRSKVLAERVVLDFVRERNLDAVILNPVAPLGQGDIKPTPTGEFILRFLAKKIPFYMEGISHYVHINDVISGHIAAIERGRKGERYILGSNNAKMSEIYALLEKVSGVSAKKIMRIPFVVAYLGGLCFDLLSFIIRRRVGIPLNSVKYARMTAPYSFEKAIKELGVSQTPIENALRDSVTWFRGDFEKFKSHRV